MKPISWLRAQRQKHPLGMLTGQDRRALEAFAAIWELLCTDGNGHRAAIEAAVALLPAMQPKCWFLAKELIARSLDWDDREKVWAAVEQVVLDRAAIEKDSEPRRWSALFNQLCELRANTFQAPR